MHFCILLFLLFFFIFSNEESRKASVYRGLGEGKGERGKRAARAARAAVVKGSRAGEERGKKEDPEEESARS